MERTEKIMQVMQETLNKNETCQKTMTMLAEMAEEKGLTMEEWQQFKQAMFTSLFYKLALENADIKAALGKDIYEDLRG